MTAPQRSVDLKAIARERLIQYGFLVEPPSGALSEAARLSEPDFGKLGYRDMTGLLWSSIDNDDSRDLDQIEYLGADSNGSRLYIGVADVASFVARGSALDQAAGHNTTSLYLGVQTVPMLPLRLSTDVTSLLEGQKRLAVVVEMRISPDGVLGESNVYRAIVENQAQLTYQAVGSWLKNSTDRQAGEDRDAPLPHGRGSAGISSPVTERVLRKIGASEKLQEQLRRQDELAQVLRRRRCEAGALPLETLEIRPEPSNGSWNLMARGTNSATRLIEDFMIAANRATVGYLQGHNFPAVRRVVRTPKDWPLLVKLAGQHGFALPSEPDSKALEDFLIRQQVNQPDRYADLSLAVIKLLGRGEYVVGAPGEEAPGHFGLAVEAYAHSTAPNRRYPDVLTQRLLQAATAGLAPPYSIEVLTELAQHCTLKEDDAKKAERAVHKSVVAAAMSNRIGETFEGMITGASEKGVWVRLNNPPVEGKLEGNTAGRMVGDRVRVKLVLADPWRGHIDFHLLDNLPRQ